jgi:hypothetical protein
MFTQVRGLTPFALRSPPAVSRIALSRSHPRVFAHVRALAPLAPRALAFSRSHALTRTHAHPHMFEHVRALTPRALAPPSSQSHAYRSRALARSVYACALVHGRTCSCPRTSRSHAPFSQSRDHAHPCALVCPHVFAHVCALVPRALALSSLVLALWCCRAYRIALCAHAPSRVFVHVRAPAPRSLAPALARSR